ncbi:homoserine dehydrogenase, partial [Oscillospiraceae bacterium OttesenSCG-928-F05]|nr:homoserine dehydrogenase [Oscillospiraceae bacterium OttesenSCG-928-F05]
PIDVKYILDVRSFPGHPAESLFVKDFSAVENDPDVQIVVEVIGGTEPALDFTRRALKKGKSVITSNKELVATHGAELLALARENGANYLFEASVGGGIPIIRPIHQCLAANEIDEIFGILNGTTNYILTRMVKQGLSFETALAEAKEKGYAEQNPAADIEGIDACRKICILASLAFGSHMAPEWVPTEGITRVTLEDVRIADAAGYAVKLLGRCVRMGDGTIAAYVSPHLVSKQNPLSTVEDVFNAITVRGNASGDLMFYGRGAGKLPTASAVVADVIDAAKHLGAPKQILWKESSTGFAGDPGKLVMRRYVRAEAELEAVYSAFGTGVMLLDTDGETAFITPLISGGEFDAKLAAFGASAAVRSVLPVLPGENA